MAKLRIPFYMSLLVMVIVSMLITGCGNHSGNGQPDGDVVEENDSGTDQPPEAKPEIVITPGVTTFSENGGSGSFSVVLGSRPNGIVVINAVSQDTKEVIVSNTQLTFTANNWNISQTVVLNGVDDDLADGNQVVTIQLNINTATSDTTGYTSLTAGNISVTVTDDDTPGITVTPSSVNVSETGTSAGFDVVLNATPNGSVLVDLANADTSEIVLNAMQVAFDETNWNSAQTVTATGVDDIVADGNQVVNIALSVNTASTDSSGYKTLTNLPSVEVTVIDNDAPGITVTPFVTSFSENAGTGRFDVVLNSKPSDDVVVNIASANTNEAVVNNSTLTFTSANWSTAQSLNLTGENDDRVDGNQLVDITFSIAAVTTDATGYATLAPQSFQVTVQDDDTAGVTATTPDGTALQESPASSIRIMVVLNTQPDGNVLIDVQSNDTSEATVDKTQLTFTPTDWRTAQTITVNGVVDFIADGTQTPVIMLAVNAATTDTTGYLMVDPANVSLTVSNDDTVGVTATPTNLGSVNEGSAGNVSIVLDSQPDGDVIIDVASQDTSEAQTNKTQLTFNATNWNLAQELVVNALDDAIVDGDQSLSVALTMNPGTTDTTGYKGFNPTDIAITVVDTTVPPPLSITMFNAGTTNGNFGGRAGADARCINAAPVSCAGKAKIHAFLSTTTSDEIRDMPGNFEYNTSVAIEGPTGTRISNDWNGLLVDSTGNLLSSLATAGVLPANVRWWSGTLSNGTSIGLDSFSCTNWTNSASGQFDNGIAGSSVQTDRRWLSDGTFGITFVVTNVKCNTQNYVLCICGK